MANAVLDEVLDGKSLDGFERLMDTLVAAERQRDQLLDDARRTLEFALGLPAHIHQLWQRSIRLPSAELHPRRSLVGRAVEEAIRVVELAESMMPVATDIAGQPLPGCERLAAARADLSQFADLIRIRWTSQEELEELMAETFELPEWLTKGPIPPHLRPPQSWYDETTDPSKPAAG